MPRDRRDRCSDALFDALEPRQLLTVYTAVPRNAVNYAAAD